LFAKERLELFFLRSEVVQKGRQGVTCAEQETQIDLNASRLLATAIEAQEKMDSARIV
jgi:hypothetical protein